MNMQSRSMRFLTLGLLVGMSHAAYAQPVANGSLEAGSKQKEQSDGTARNFEYERQLIGADISWAPSQEDRGTTFSDQGVEKDVLKILADHKFNWIRLRLFVDPTAENGYSRHGYCGLEQTLTMAKRVEAAGMKLLLDFHYSDTWADPGKQFTPASWKGLSDDELVDKIYEYTHSVIKCFAAEGVTPEMVQIGNEIHNGFLWPQGRIKDSPETFGSLLRRASEAVREADPNIKIMVHPALGGDNGRSVRFFDLVLSHDVVFDVIGQSYYPEHHGTLEQLESNLTDLANRYRKPIVVVEYQKHRKEVNEIVRDLPGNLGWGTFIWEATSPRWGGLFDRDGATNDKIDIYPAFFASVESDQSESSKAASEEETTAENMAGDIKVVRDIAYRKGDSKAWRLDLAMPAAETDELRPALVIVHGGGWRAGSKEVDVFQKMMTDYANKGYVTINVEYRLTGEAPFPACIEDVKCAVRWLRAHAEEYGVDPDRIGAYGHSAGAHLALMLAMVPKSAGLEGDGDWDKYSSRVNVAAAGSPPTELGRDVPMAKTEWWPIGYISAEHPPLFLIQGGQDRIVRPERTEDFVEKMKAAGADIKYLKIEGDGHGVAYAESLDVTDPALEEFFAKHLQPEVNVKAARTGSGAEETAAMDALLQSFVDQKKVSSVVGLVAKDGQVKYQKAFGWKDVENQIPATVDDYYVLFSQTKAVVTVAFMTLVEKGLVAIDDPVAKYFPEIPDRVVTEVHEDGTYETRPVASPMTFAHLMSHSSGLNAGLVGQIRRAEKKQSDRPPGFGGRIPEKVPAGQHSGGGNFDTKYLKDEMHALAKYPLGFDPGTEWSYHVSTNMLGYLIERISGKPLREYVKETVLEPLEMDETDWYYQPEAISRFVKPYRVVDGRLEPASTMYSEGTVSKEQTYCEGAIGLNGPIGDYAKFCQMLLNQGELNGRRILKPETVKLMTTVNQLPEKNAGGEGFQFGLGFELYNEHKKPVPEVSNSAYAWGGLMGTQYIIDPEHDMIALFYINMYGAEPLYPSFLGKAYQLFSPSGTTLEHNNGLRKTGERL